MSSYERFTVVYDGPALAEHRMDVRDLAPALVAIADLFSAANAALNGKATDIRVEVKGSFRAGSFHIELIFLQHLLTQIRDIFAGDTANALSNAWAILGVLGFVSGGGVISLLRKLRGRNPHQIEPAGKLTKVWITKTEYMEINEKVLLVWRSKTVRACLQKIFEPLGREGITNFGIVREEEVVLLVDDTELPSFSMDTEEGQIVSDSTVRKVLFLESVVFKDGNKWRVHDGQHPFFASLDDEYFLAKINSGERFGKGDVLDVDLRQVQTIEGDSLKIENYIVKVHEHRTSLQRSLI